MGPGRPDTCAAARREAAGWSVSDATAGGSGPRRAAVATGAAREGHAPYVVVGASPRARLAQDAGRPQRAA